jgi:hypothetical protein
MSLSSAHGRERRMRTKKICFVTITCVAVERCVPTKKHPTLESCVVVGSCAWTKKHRQTVDMSWGCGAARTRKTLPNAFMCKETGGVRERKVEGIEEYGCRGR